MTVKDSKAFVIKVLILIFGYTIALGTLLGFIMGFMSILSTPL